MGVLPHLSVHPTPVFVSFLFCVTAVIARQTVELSATQQLLKDAGVKCSKRDLGLYLDEKGITFVDRSGRTRDSPSKKRRRAADGSGRASSSQT